MVIYGIKNCNTVKKALDWLNQNNLRFDFHDFKSKGITPTTLESWCEQVGWENLVNKRGTTWRQLDETVQKTVVNEKNAIKLMLEKTSVIKRPIIERDGKILTLGFDLAEYEKIFGSGQ